MRHTAKPRLIGWFMIPTRIPPVYLKMQLMPDEAVYLDKMTNWDA
jgi:hypothetical protein